VAPAPGANTWHQELVPGIGANYWCQETWHQELVPGTGANYWCQVVVGSGGGSGCVFDNKNKRTEKYWS
jgi:hypothetical protein